MKCINKKNIYTILILISLLGILLLQLVVRVLAIHDNYILYSLIFCSLMLLLIFSSVLSLNKKGKINFKFHTPLLISWFALCLFFLYSDIAVPKKYCFLSLELLILFTSVFFVWQQYSAKDRGKLWSIFRLAIEIAFLTATIFCFLFRPYQSGIRYSGLSANPNVYAMFLVTVWACLITRLDYKINNSEPPLKCIFTFAEFGCVLYFMYMTGARTSFLAISLITFVWFCFRFVLCRKNKQKIMNYVLIGLCFSAVSFAISFGLLATMPHIVNHPIVFERDRAFASIDTEPSVCLANDKSNNDSVSTPNNAVKDVENAIDNVENEPSLIKRIRLAFQNGSDLDTILNGRLSIYKNYINKINNIGHRKYGRKINGTFVVNAHNNAIQVAYTYGRPAMIAYIILCILCVFYAIRYYIKYYNTKKNAVLPLLITIGFIITSLTECILLPMQSLLAFSFYLVIGELINSQKD